MKWFKPMYTDKMYEGVITVKEINKEKHRVTYTCEVFDKESGEQTISGEATLMNRKQYVWED